MAKPQPKPARKPATTPEGKPAKAAPEPPGQVRLQEQYHKSVWASLRKEFSYTNRMQVPRLACIVLNVGMGEATQNVKLLDSAVKELATITGQHPVMTRARKAIANFKLRKGLPIGAKVTLRGKRMYEFLDRLVTAALPRIRDFKEFSPRPSDLRGNYTLGLKEHLIFPETKYDAREAIHGR